MKKKATVIVSVIVLSILLFAVIILEKSNKTPMQRYLESSQIAKATDNYIPVKLLNDDGNLQFEFLSYDLIDDKDIEKQTKYKAEYFIDGKVPLSDYVVRDIDYEALRRDYPKYDEFYSSNGEKGMTYEEAGELVREHGSEYMIDKHIKTKYLFVRCRITYVGNGRSEEWLNLFDIFVMRGNAIVGLCNMNCYLDNSQHREEGVSEDDFFRYKFEKVGDSVECVMGCRIRGDFVDLSEENIYYVGFQPGTRYSDYDQFNPAIDRRCVALRDIPKET